MPVNRILGDIFVLIPPYLAPFADQRRYCLWLNVPDETTGQPRKIPFGAGDRGAAARSDDPSTWLTWAEMLVLARKLPCIPTGNEGGPGIFLGDGLVGFDLDSCIGPDGLAQWAADLLPLLGDGVEISPSGTGLKSFLWAPDPATVKQILGWNADRSGGPLWKSPDGTQHPAGIEYYDSFRYFAVTGNAIVSASGGSAGRNLSLLTVDVARQIRSIVDDLIARFGTRRSLRVLPGGAGGAGGVSGAGGPGGGGGLAVLPDQGLARVRACVLAALPVRVKLAALLAGAPVDGLSDQSRSSRAYHLAQEMIVACGLSESDWIEFVCQEAETGGLIRCEALRTWIAEKGLREDYRELKRAYRNTPPGLSLLSFAGVPPIDGGSGAGSGAGIDAAADDPKPGTIVRDIAADTKVIGGGPWPDLPLFGPNLDDAGRLVVSLSPADLYLNFQAVQQALLWSCLPIFIRANSLVVPVETVLPAGRNKTTQATNFNNLTVPGLQLLMARVGNWQRFDMRRRPPALLPVEPPEGLAKVVLAPTGYWKFPEVAGILTSPTIRPNGSVLATEGYDTATRMWCSFGAGFETCSTWGNDVPTYADAQAALSLLDSLLDEFPFETTCDRSVALSYLLTSVARTAMDVAPLHAFRANAPGSGKTYLIDIGSVMTTGRVCPVISAGIKPEEQEKRLSGMLQAGIQLISIDNLNGELRGDLLCQVVERPYVRLRPLGKNDTVEVENKSLIVANGNQMRVIGDMARRTLFCALYIDMERPETRVFTRDPVGEVLKNRAKYVKAALIVVRAHILAGSPGVPMLREQYASFGDYSAIVRGALVWLGREDPLDTARNNREQDPDYQNLMVFLTAWRDRIGVGRKTACTLRQAFDMALQTAPPLDSNGFAQDLRTENKEEIPVEERARRQFSDVLRTVMLEISGERVTPNYKILGKWLLQHEKRIACGLRFEKGKSDRTGISTWFIDKSMNGLRVQESGKKLSD